MSELLNLSNLAHSREYLDFGKGFYLTTILGQAEKYALRFIRRGKKAFIDEYFLDDNLSGFNVKTFSRYDEEWLEYVGACRLGKEHQAFDMISGGIYDSETFNLISEGVADLHCMSDQYLVDELLAEYVL